MFDLESTLKQHEIGWVGEGLSCKRDVPFFYRKMPSRNRHFLVDVITASPRHKDWYCRIYRDNILLRKDLHFETAEAAYAAALEIETEEQAGELSLRQIERWKGATRTLSTDTQTSTQLSAKSNLAGGGFSLFARITVPAQRTVDDFRRGLPRTAPPVQA